VQIAREEGDVWDGGGYRRGRDIGISRVALLVMRWSFASEHIMSVSFTTKYACGIITNSQKAASSHKAMLRSPSSTRHADVPPDNWIPEQDVDQSFAFHSQK